MGYLSDRLIVFIERRAWDLKLYRYFKLVPALMRSDCMEMTLRRQAKEKLGDARR